MKFLSLLGALLLLPLFSFSKTDIVTRENLTEIFQIELVNKNFCYVRTAYTFSPGSEKSHVTINCDGSNFVSSLTFPVETSEALMTFIASGLSANQLLSVSCQIDRSTEYTQVSICWFSKR
jgi:hypothetical protein